MLAILSAFASVGWSASAIGQPAAASEVPMLKLGVQGRERAQLGFREIPIFYRPASVCGASSSSRKDQRCPQWTSAECSFEFQRTPTLACFYDFEAGTVHHYWMGDLVLPYIVGVWAETGQAIRLSGNVWTAR